MTIDCRRREDIDHIYRKTGKAALSKIYYLIARREVAEDLLQEVFVRLWQSGIVFSSEKSAYSWIYRSCHNVAIDYLRSAIHRKEQSYDILQDTFAPCDNHFGTGVLTRDLLGKMLTKLSAHEVQLFLYRTLDGMSQEETAHMMGLARKTVIRQEDKLRLKLQKIRELVC